jgi:hypothetical protein
MLRSSMRHCGSRAGAHLQKVPSSVGNLRGKGIQAMLSLMVELLRQLSGNREPDDTSRRAWVLD